MIKIKKKKSNEIFNFCKEILQEPSYLIDIDKIYTIFGYCLCGNKLKNLGEYTSSFDMTQKTLCVVLQDTVNSTVRSSNQIIPRCNVFTTTITSFKPDCRSLKKENYYLAFFPNKSDDNETFDKYMIFQNKIRTLFIDRYNYAYSNAENKEEFLFSRYINIIRNLKLISSNIDNIFIQDIIDHYLLEGKILSEDNITIEEQIMYLLKKNKCNSLYCIEIILELFHDFRDIVDEIIEIDVDNNEIIFGKILLIKNIQYLSQVGCLYASKFIKDKFKNMIQIINKMEGEDIEILHQSIPNYNNNNETILEKKKRILEGISWRFKTLF